MREFIMRHYPVINFTYPMWRLVNLNIANARRTDALRLTKAVGAMFGRADSNLEIVDFDHNYPMTIFWH